MNIVSNLDYRGRPFIMKQSTWDNHISTGHPELNNCIMDIERSVTNPFLVVQDMITSTEGDSEVNKVNKNREEYYGSIITNDNRLRILKTIVDHSTAPAEIVTSTISTRVKINIEGGILYDARMQK